MLQKVCISAYGGVELQYSTVQYQRSAVVNARIAFMAAGVNKNAQYTGRISMQNPLRILLGAGLKHRIESANNPRF